MQIAGFEILRLKHKKLISLFLKAYANMNLLSILVSRFLFVCRCYFYHRLRSGEIMKRRYDGRREIVAARIMGTSLDIIIVAVIGVITIIVVVTAGDSYCYCHIIFYLYHYYYHQ